MSELIEHGESDENAPNTINIERNKPDVPLETYQDIYHQITGRTEYIRKRFSENILVDFAEIEQLNYKINQLCNVYRVIAKNEVVSVFYEKERKEQYTSFERFQLNSSNSAQPTISVVLKYNFSILLPERSNPQEYVVKVRLVSRVAMLKSIEEEVPSFMRGRLLRFDALHSAEISVEYVDYVVARSFIDSFSEWVGGCNSNPKNRFLDKAQDYSYFIPKFLQLSLISILLYYFYEVAKTKTSPSSDSWLQFFIIFSGAFYFVHSISLSAGKIIERAIDTFQQISYLKLNRGDDKLISQFSKRNRAAIFKFVVGCMVTVCLGILSTKLSEII